MPIHILQAELSQQQSLNDIFHKPFLIAIKKTYDLRGCNRSAKSTYVGSLRFQISISEFYKPRLSLRPTKAYKLTKFLMRAFSEKKNRESSNQNVLFADQIGGALKPFLERSLKLPHHGIDNTGYIWLDYMLRLDQTIYSTTKNQPG